ncbi:hypothetical protein C6I20_11970 [Aeromicrobium sp. A1-2]|uniref:hypothetical protein n=1 Tax=Aeromicrobium sp. A1-2 TaxID=2107713 RepID=UPI000E46B427|nr:hypothetical protein [Aeromicrobium sp. A1-2]AXT85833.1 hypothetical protein C6I20_11970 [Aeromicrobium sp. A1-2]
MLTRARAAVLTLTALTLSACSAVHPGDAAVVAGESISMKSLNQTAAIYCTLTLRSAEAQGGAAPDNAELRRQAITSLVSVVIARRLAADAGVTPRPSDYELTGAQKDQIATAFPKGDLDQINAAIEDSQEISVISIALGADSTGQARTEANEAELAQAGRAQINAAYADNDVKFAPRFGLSSTTKQIASTGSISVAPADLAAPQPTDLPAAQRCS